MTEEKIGAAGAKASKSYFTINVAPVANGWLLQGHKYRADRGCVASEGPTFFPSLAEVGQELEDLLSTLVYREDAANPGGQNYGMFG